MPITRTINYTQNVPESLGFASYLNPSPSRTVKVAFDFNNSSADAKMGTITFPTVTGVTQSYSTNSTGQTIFTEVSIEGPVAAINTALNGAEFVNHFYEAETLDQDFLSLNRATPTDLQGELQIQINKDVVHGLSVGSFCRISTVSGNSGVDGRYLVTAIDNSNSPTRLWLVYRGDYGIDDTYYGSTYKTVSSGATCVLQNTSSVTIAAISDISYSNPHGNFSVVMSVVEGVTTVDSGTISFVGSFFISEPQFATSGSDFTQTAGQWTSDIDLGSISQADDNYQSLQLLIKYLPNDPRFLGLADYSSFGSDWAAIAAAIDGVVALDEGVYVTDHTRGKFGAIQTGTRSSADYASGEVRWSYYDTPDNINDALTKISFFTPPSATGELNIETRIVNGRTRIYRNRGAL